MSNVDLVELLSYLLKHAQKPVSGERLARHFSVSRPAIWKHIKQLEKQGFSIEARPREGYRLVALPQRLSPILLKARLKRDIIYVPRVNSTNDLALKLGLENHKNIIVVTDEQTQGRGRWGRTWKSQPDSIALSFFIYEKIYLESLLPIYLAVTFSVGKAIQELTGYMPQLHWPNDVFIQGKKAAGILVETFTEGKFAPFLVVGIGLNVNSHPPFATSLADLTGHYFDRHYVIDRLVKQWENTWWNFKKDPAKIIHLFAKYHPIQILSEIELDGKTHRGLIEGIDNQGRLIFKCGSSSWHLGLDMVKAVKMTGKIL
ncbi:MAG: biotin--[acetyl-CoA-carboxylase] ligase [Candidatus Desulfofervidaceae bacterium]|nr:biotin--[acetyl-CoA-carboxylase] ligase [Candidatus Desulfofervidaceae bacterium]